MVEPHYQPRKVLFLCTGNSCRSQIAEAIVNYFMIGEWEAYSAGTKPTGYVHPKVIQVLFELGIDHQGHSKNIEQFHLVPLDLVVTVCDSAAEECPHWLGESLVVHQNFTNPVNATGTEEEILIVFRKVRDQIIQQIPSLLRLIATNSKC